MISSLRRLFKYPLNRIRTHNLLRFPISSDIGLTSTYEGANKIGENCVFNGIMGFGTYMGSCNSITARIGRFTSIGHNCSILTGRHPYSYPYVSTSPVFYSLKQQCGFSYADRQVFMEEHVFANYEDQLHIEIGNDCWIQSDVRFVSGIHIADGAVVLSGSVVTKDVPPYAVVGGVPARIINYRYSEEDIQLLLNSKWWNKDLSWIKDNWSAFNDFEQFKRIIKDGKC